MYVLRLDGIGPDESHNRKSGSQYPDIRFRVNRNNVANISLSGLIAAAGFPPLDRPRHTWRHLQQEPNLD